MGHYVAIWNDTAGFIIMWAALPGKVRAAPWMRVSPSRRASAVLGAGQGRIQSAGCFLLSLSRILLMTVCSFCNGEKKSL